MDVFHTRFNGSCMAYSRYLGWYIAVLAVHLAWLIAGISSKGIAAQCLSALAELQISPFFICVSFGSIGTPPELRVMSPDVVYVRS